MIRPVPQTMRALTSGEASWLWPDLSNFATWFQDIIQESPRSRPGTDTGSIARASARWRRGRSPRPIASGADGARRGHRAHRYCGDLVKGARSGAATRVDRARSALRARSGGCGRGRSALRARSVRCARERVRCGARSGGCGRGRSALRARSGGCGRGRSTLRARGVRCARERVRCALRSARHARRLEPLRTRSARCAL